MIAIQDTSRSVGGYIYPSTIKYRNGKIQSSIGCGPIPKDFKTWDAALQIVNDITDSGVCPNTVWRIVSI